MKRGLFFVGVSYYPSPRDQGLIFVFRPMDQMERVSLRLVTMDVPAQDVITRDNVTLKVNAIVYFRVVDANLAIVSVENYLYATSQLAQTRLRSVLGEVELDDVLSKRGGIERALTVDFGPIDRSLGDQGVDGGGENRGPAVGNAASDGETG